VIHVDIHQTIERPIGDVFERIADVRRYSEWMPGTGSRVACAQDSAGPALVLQPSLESRMRKEDP
jgi:hypothetical protein